VHYSCTRCARKYHGRGWKSCTKPCFLRREAGLPSPETAHLGHVHPGEWVFCTGVHLRSSGPSPQGATSSGPSGSTRDHRDLSQRRHTRSLSPASRRGENNTRDRREGPRLSSSEDNRPNMSAAPRYHRPDLSEAPWHRGDRDRPNLNAAPWHRNDQNSQRLGRAPWLAGNQNSRKLREAPWHLEDRPERPRRLVEDEEDVEDEAELVAELERQRARTPQLLNERRALERRQIRQYIQERTRENEQLEQYLQGQGRGSHTAQRYARSRSHSPIAENGRSGYRTREEQCFRDSAAPSRNNASGEFRGGYGYLSSSGSRYEDRREQVLHRDRGAMPPPPSRGAMPPSGPSLTRHRSSTLANAPTGPSRGRGEQRRSNRPSN